MFLKLFFIRFIDSVHEIMSICTKCNTLRHPWMIQHVSRECLGQTAATTTVTQKGLHDRHMATFNIPVLYKLTLSLDPQEVKQINRDGTFCRVLLSMHASCLEVLDLVSYLRPRKVYPNVIPTNSSKEEVRLQLCCINVRIRKCCIY